ncbi:hypothetical protein TFKS16_2901 [Tannerella forsythia KS16]|uniref:DUF3289 family protein n=1 Tax=Tannerella forsythia TaxID=28112 RepID=UPI000618A04A|nr:DUF3289 family protein [Tannerella forsythia]BAR50262.1 hypothetical protein TF3313_2850 [Tannerella forsythia 3313]BAR53065.1 hypothetical protein TFKS16_2901 [Tannerella forsythia KS16]
MSIRAVLCINRREYRVLRYRQRFARRVSSNGMPASDLYGGTIDVEFESERDSGVFALMTDENTPTIEGYLRISPSEEDTMVRELKFDEAYLVGYSEQQYDDWGAPVTMCVSISPIRLDFNRTVCIERRNSSIWREYRVEKPLFKAPVHTPPSPLVTSVKGEETALPTHTVKYTVTGYNLATIGASDRERVKWLVRVDGRDEQLSQRGETLELTIKPEWTGKDVTVMPYLRKPNEEVSVKTTVERFPKSILFARSMKRPGKTLTGETAEDMLCADKTPEEVRRMHRLFGLQLKASDKELFADMYMLASMGSLSGGGELLTALIGHFKDSTGTPFSNAYMDQKLKEHPSFHTFVYQKDKGVLDNLKKQLKKVLGNIKRVKLLQEGEIRSDRTKFNTLKDKLNGMTLAVDDTSAYEVYVDDYKLTAPNTFSCNLRIIVYDNYGLDAEDVAKYGTIAGFRAWYVLQHVRGYKPFLTKMTCIIPIKNQTF